ncbi:MAG: ATP-binding protein [Leptospiraceae bacterium]|nr:ATP-binding protein [Leptospiraceae bacterium]MCZ8348066.1 ATP-binding protein [Leptospiraceae bacterium]
MEENTEYLTSEIENLESILDGITEPILQISSDFNIAKANQTAIDFINLSREELDTKKCYEAIYKRDEVCPYCPIQKTQEEIDINLSFPIKQNGKRNSISREILFKKKDRTQNLYLDFFPILNKDNTIGSFVEKISDITSIKEKDEESLRMRNLASIGILVSGVAHELNNPLTGISLTLQNLQKSIKTSSVEFIEKRLDMIRTDLTKAAFIVNEIISFAKSDKLKVSQGDICETIQKAYENAIRLYPVLSKNIEWELNFENNYFMPFNPFKIERVFLNLFRNSLQVFDYRSGKITVEVRKTKNMIHVIVEDNAGGMSSSVISKIFDPFFSNNKQSNGTGLGLSIVYSVIKEHNGNISVKSYDDITRFTISLPYGSGEALA